MSPVRTDKVIKLITHGNMVNKEELRDFIQAIDNYKKEADIDPLSFSWVDFTPTYETCPNSDCENSYQTLDGSMSWTAPQFVPQPRL